jgi:hypothetical protein
MANIVFAYGQDGDRNYNPTQEGQVIGELLTKNGSLVSIVTACIQKKNLVVGVLNGEAIVARAYPCATTGTSSKEEAYMDVCARIVEITL